MGVTIYGIPNCDTMKKARAWLQAQGVAHDFHDYKKQGADTAQVIRWCTALGWHKLLNRAGTTFRKLPQADRDHLTEARAIALMQAQPSLIKRPVLDVDGQLTVGFHPETYAAACAKYC
jgi:arsenate reductase